MSKQSTTFDDVVAVGTSNARAALDHLGDPFYVDPVASYRQNVIDTIEELDATHYLAFALAAYDDKTIAEPPSARCAIELADALNAVRKAFLDCGSDREVIRLSQRITNALTESCSTHC